MENTVMNMGKSEILFHQPACWPLIWPPVSALYCILRPSCSCCFRSGKIIHIGCLFVKIQCCGSGSGAFLTPGSGIRNMFFPDLGSQTHSFESLVTIFWILSSIILWNLGLQKQVWQQIFSTPLIFCCFFIRDPGWVKMIRDKRPGSSTLEKS